MLGTTEFQTCHDNQFTPGTTLPEAAGREDLWLVTPSQWSKAGFVNSGYREERICVLPHGIATTIFQPAQPEEKSLYRQMLGIEADEFALLNVGSLLSCKGIDLLISAFANLKPRHPKLKLLLKDQSNLYSVTLKDVLRSIAESGRELQLKDSDWNDVITISDNLDLDSLRALYCACDADVSPYRAEGFNIPPLEAAACGLPIIATAGGATDDHFSPELGLQVASSLRTHGQGGIYLEPDLESLQVAIEQVLATPQRWGGTAGSERVHNLYSWQHIGDRLWDLLSVG